MILHMRNKECEQKAWGMWVARYPTKGKDDFIPFSEFFESLKPKQISKKTKEEMLEEVQKIRAKIGR